MVDNSEGDDSQLEINSPQIIEEVIKKPNGDFVKKYKKGKFLGKGGFAKCYEFQCLNNKKIYAVKIVSKANLNKPSAKQKLKSEIKIHKSLFHKHIVKFEHVFEDNENVYILLELCKNRTLSDVMKKRKIITEFEARYFIAQILKAVKFMHSNKYIHRDLKLGNLFLNENMEIKIGDFGLATIVEFPGQLRHTVCGTPNYIAPEILEKNAGHSYEVDFWAIGVIVYTLLIGRPPYETDDVKETYRKIKCNEYSFPNHIFISPEAKDFISKILIINPLERMKIDEMKNHDWMKMPYPKLLPDQIAVNPVSYSFLTAHLIEIKGITNSNEISIVESQYMNYLESLKKHAEENIFKVENKINETKFHLLKKEIASMITLNNNKDFIIRRSSSVNMRKKDSIMNMKYLVNFNELSYRKEYSNCLGEKIPEIKVSNLKITLLEKIIDLNEVGVAYVTNTGQVGVVFSDKTTLFTFISSKKYYYKETNKELSELKEKDKKEGEMIQKIGLLENLIKEYSTILKEQKPIELKEIEYPIRFFKSDLAFFFRFINYTTQLIFYDYTKLIIGSNTIPMVIFISRTERVSSINIHQVNKSKDKNMLKRYEHYKKIFYEKLEQRFNEKVASNDVENVEEEQNEVEASQDDDANQTL